MSNITTILYYISDNKVVVKVPFAIVRETPNYYYTAHGRYLKSEMGIPFKKSASSYPYIELNMVDADEQTLRRELSKWFEKRAKEISPRKIVRLDIIDEELNDYDEHFIETFYLINPDEEKLEFLKSKIEHRYDGEGDEEFEQFSAVYDYVIKNFNLLNVEGYEIQW